MAKADETTEETNAAPEKETPRAKFLRLGEARMSSALHALTVIGNLGAPAYEYTDEDVDKIEKALTDKLAEVVAHLRNPGERKAETFKFS